jgi:thymidylate synthase (FAD)
MKHCIKSGHTSVTEFCDFTFHIEGISRALSHQLVRHRLASYAQRSQRYCSEGNFNYVVPKSIKSNQGAFEEYTEIMYQITDMYRLLQEMGIPNEDARMVLPNACETVIEVKMNLRTLMNFMNERLCTCAQWEIRELALAMKKAIVEKYPELEPYLVPKCEKYGKEFGFCMETKQRREQLKCKRHPRLAEIFEYYHNYKDMCES